MGVRIGGASAFYGDSQLAARQLVQYGDVQYLVFDYLAEVTMAILARAQMRNPDLGYALDFVTVAMADVIQDCAEKGIKVLANAGGVNVPACITALQALANERGLSLKIAGVYGDDLRASRTKLADADLSELQTGEPLPEELASINAYFGAAPIASALDAGADIVVTGRVVDSALVLAPLMHEYKWSLEDYDRLAQGALCGHVIECGAQCTGGNYTDWQSVPDFSNISFPVADVDADGTFTIGIPDNTGGLATVGSVAEQIVYEIGDPANYLLPDVACDFSNVQLQQIDRNLVRVSGAKGRAPGTQYKVCATWIDGYRLMGQFYMAGPRSVQKAKTGLSAFVKRCETEFAHRGWSPFRRTNIEIVGSEGIYGKHARQLDSREVLGKYGLHHDSKQALSFAASEMAFLATSGPPALSGYAAGRPKPQPLMRLHSCLLDKSKALVTVQLGDQVLSKRVYNNDSSVECPAPVYHPHAQNTDLDTEVSLEQLAFVRSGDKGDNANIGVIARKPEFLPLLADQLTESVIADYFSHLLEGDVKRYYLPGLSAFNFLLSKALGGGGTASLRLDAQAKTYGQMLLSYPIRIPNELLTQ